MWCAKMSTPKRNEKGHPIAKLIATPHGETLHIEDTEVPGTTLCDMFTTDQWQDAGEMVQFRFNGCFECKLNYAVRYDL